MREMLPLLRRHAPQARVVLDTVDLHYLRERRGAEVMGDAGATPSAGRPRALEEVRSTLQRIGGPGLPFAQRRDLVFVGGFRHPPNADAVHWFVSAVWPLLRMREPTLQLHVLGSDVHADVQALG